MTDTAVIYTWAWRKLRDQRIKEAAANQEPCIRCGKPIDYQLPGTHRDGPTGDHIHPLVHGGELLNPDLIGPAHRRCNSRHGGRIGNKSSKRSKGAFRKEIAKEKVIPVSLGHSPQPMPALGKSLQQCTDKLPDKPWIPELGNRPRIESPISPDAVGSYGGAFVEWCRTQWPEVPLPWQAYVAARALEHGRDGELLHRRVGISVPRQVGKSVFLRMLAAWRINQESLFGEPQTVLHVAHALNTTEEVFYPALMWARRRGYRVREANGQMKIQVGENRWVPRSTQTGYGFTLSLALVDEAWAVAERRVNSGYAPTLSARSSGQVWMFSSANEEATPLFPRFRDGAVGRDGWLLLEWSAEPGASLDDRGVWAAASPVPLDARRSRLMADELVSDARTFGFERLNRWPVQSGVPWGERVAGLLRPPGGVVFGGVLVGALESEPDGSGWGAAVSDGVSVECVEVRSQADAFAWLVARSPVRVLAHGAVVKRGGGDGLVLEAVGLQEMAAATGVLRDLVPGLVWSGPLGDRLRGAGVAVSGSGERVDAGRSTGPVAVVKAASWALWGAVSVPSVAPVIW